MKKADARKAAQKAAEEAAHNQDVGAAAEAVAVGMPSAPRVRSAGVFSGGVPERPTRARVSHDASAQSATSPHTPPGAPPGLGIGLLHPGAAAAQPGRIEPFGFRPTQFPGASAGGPFGGGLSDQPGAAGPAQPVTASGRGKGKARADPGRTGMFGGPRVATPPQRPAPERMGSMDVHLEGQVALPDRAGARGIVGVGPRIGHPRMPVDPAIQAAAAAAVDRGTRGRDRPADVIAERVAGHGAAAMAGPHHRELFMPDRGPDALALPYMLAVTRHARPDIPLAQIVEIQGRVLDAIATVRARMIERVANGFLTAEHCGLGALAWWATGLGQVLHSLVYEGASSLLMSGVLSDAQMTFLANVLSSGTIEFLLNPGSVGLGYLAEAATGQTAITLANTLLLIWLTNRLIEHSNADRPTPAIMLATGTVVAHLADNLEMPLLAIGAVQRLRVTQSPAERLGRQGITFREQMVIVAEWMGANIQRAGAAAAAGAAMADQLPGDLTNYVRATTQDAAAHALGVVPGAVAAAAQGATEETTRRRAQADLQIAAADPEHAALLAQIHEGEHVQPGMAAVARNIINMFLGAVASVADSTVVVARGRGDGPPSGIEKLNQRMAAWLVDNYLSHRPGFMAAEALAVQRRQSEQVAAAAPAPVRRRSRQLSRLATGPESAATRGARAALVRRASGGRTDNPAGVTPVEIVEAGAATAARGGIACPHRRASAPAVAGVAAAVAGAAPPGLTRAALAQHDAAGAAPGARAPAHRTSGASVRSGATTMSYKSAAGSPVPQTPGGGGRRRTRRRRKPTGTRKRKQHARETRKPTKQRGQRRTRRARRRSHRSRRR